ncbi:MAG: potassium channel family protein [Spirochaetota bacterium]
MKQFAIIGLDSFGVWMLEELLEVNVEVLIVDKDEAIVSQYKNQVQAAYVADAIKEDTIRKIVPPDIDAAIIDLGDRTEVSILVANYLRKMGVRSIIAKAETDEHGEILRLVGATQVVFPNREAAKRVLPPLLSDTMFTYMPISERLVLAEVRFPDRFDGKTLVEANIRNKHGLNVVAVKPLGAGEFVFVSPDYHISIDDTYLVVGSRDDVGRFGEWTDAATRGTGLFHRFFRRPTAAEFASPSAAAGNEEEDE